MRVLSLGMQTLVQDAGRTGYEHLGVPTAGAFDRRAWRLSNRLVGNPETAATLEVLGGGLVLEATRHRTLAVTGADGPVLINGRPHATHQPLHVPPSAVVVLGAPRAGLRYYVAIAGGLQLPTVLRSQATDTLGHLGPIIAVGQELPIGPAHGYPTVDHAPPPRLTTTFDISPGPDLNPRLLLGRDWDLDPQSNRIGVRLTGSPVPAPQASLPSKPMVPGAVQLPPNGLPIILGPDHPTTGGYPVVAVVTRNSLDDVAQWSGGACRFRLTPPGEGVP